MRRALVTDRAAESDLIEIWIHTFNRWGEAQADKYLGAIETGIRRLAAKPTDGRSREELRPGYWSKAMGHHVVFYTFNESELRVRRVLHEVMDFGSHLPTGEA